MLTGKPPLGHLEPHAAMFSIGSKPLNLTLPGSVSNEAKRFIKAALTWLVLLIAGIKLFSYRMDVKKIVLRHVTVGTQVSLRWSWSKDNDTMQKQRKC